MASLADAAYLVARSSAPVHHGGEQEVGADANASTFLCSTIELLESFLYAPAAELQLLAVLGLAKLLVDSACSNANVMLPNSTDLESIIGLLGYRYTTVGGHAAKKGEADPMPTMLLLFEVLAKDRLMLLSNSVVWTVLEAAEEATQKASGGIGWTLDDHSLRCIRFLFGMLPAHAMSDIVTAVRLNLEVQHNILLSDAVISEWVKPTAM